MKKGFKLRRLFMAVVDKNGHLLGFVSENRVKYRLRDDADVFKIVTKKAKKYGISFGVVFLG